MGGAFRVACFEATGPSVSVSLPDVAMARNSTSTKEPLWALDTRSKLSSVGISCGSPTVSSALSRTVGERQMADNTEWFEALTIKEAKEERIILRLWFGRVAALVSLLCVVTYATNF
jgi:hypothetical protein